MLPYDLTEAFWLAPLALWLDLRFGDPVLPWPHPVILLGRILNYMEEPAKALARLLPLPYGAALRLTGFLAVSTLLLLTGTIVFGLLNLPLFGPIFAIYLAWAGLALGSLLERGEFVLLRLKKAPLPAARRALSQLVSRETKAMDRQTLRKTLADTLTENFTDALTAPFFFLVLGGPIGLWLYKAVSTTDSMWGYRTPRFEAFGMAGARLDDLCALIPARLSILVIFLAHKLLKLTHFDPKLQGKWPGLLQVHREALGLPSPNSGCSMAAFAWLAQARLGGPDRYFGQLVYKAWLGPTQDVALPWRVELLGQLLSAIKVYGILGMLLFWAFSLLIYYIFIIF